MTHKKLIEIALSLETINTESAREKSIRHGHPSSAVPTLLAPDYSPKTDLKISTWEVLHHLIRELDGDGGIAGAANLLGQALNRREADVDKDHIKELAHQLFRIAEQESRSKDAQAFNNIVTS